MNMKRLLALALALGLMLCLCACGGTVEPVVTTEPTSESTEPTTESTEQVADANEPTYVVTVVDQDNAPVVGAWVQLCLEACVPAMTDENGVANFYLEENEYKVGFTVMPAGYEYATEEQAFPFGTAFELTITLKAVA